MTRVWTLTEHLGLAALLAVAIVLSALFFVAVTESPAATSPASVPAAAGLPRAGPAAGGYHVAPDGSIVQHTAAPALDGALISQAR